MRVLTPTNGTWQYNYDAFGNRISAAHNNGQTNYFSHDPIDLTDVVAEFDNAGTPVAYGMSSLGLVSRFDSTGVAAYYDFDALGNTREITTSSGVVANNYEYAIFGAVSVSQASLANRFTFVGRFGVMDEQEDLLFMRQRHYDSQVGRFFSQDPLWPRLVELNRLSYAGNNPVNYVDPEGLQMQGIVLTGSSLYRAEKDLKKGPSAVAGAVLGGASGWAVGTIVGGRLGVYVGGAIGVALGGPPGLFIGAFVGFYAGRLIGGLAGGYFGTHLGSDIGAGIGGGGGSGSARVAPNSIILPSVTGNSSTSYTVQAADPNGLLGPAGYGMGNFRRGDSAYFYRIDFENATNATASAQVVQISNTITTNLDLSTLEFASVGFGDYFFTIPPGSQHYEHTEEVTYNGTTFDVNIEAKVDLATRQVQVRFESVMADNGLPPAVEIGFLPPENGTGRGDGHVAYVIRPVAGLPTGTEIRNIGTITFNPLAGGPVFRTDLVDARNPNSGVDTNRQALVTIDADLPISTVTGPSGTATNTSFVATWNGSDVGAGVTSYDIFVQTNGGGWNQWLSFTTNTSAIFGGYPSQTYGFYSIARDGAGNVEAAPLVADVIVTTPTNGAPVIDPVGNSFLLVGQQLAITNIAHDPDTPLTFSLVAGAPGGVSITTNGVLRWTPAWFLAASVSTKLITVRAHRQRPAGGKRHR